MDKIILIPTQFTNFIIELPMQVVCWDDEMKPESIPMSNWVVKNKIYTVERVLTLKNGFGQDILGFELVAPKINFFPYSGFSAMRFYPILDELQYFNALQNEPVD